MWSHFFVLWKIVKIFSLHLAFKPKETYRYFLFINHFHSFTYFPFIKYKVSYETALNHTLTLSRQKNKRIFFCRMSDQTQTYCTYAYYWTSWMKIYSSRLLYNSDYYSNRIFLTRHMSKSEKPYRLLREQFQLIIPIPHPNSPYELLRLLQHLSSLQIWYMVMIAADDDDE